MTRDINPWVLEEVRKRLPLVKPEYIYFFEDDSNKLQGKCTGNLPLSAVVIGINHRLSTKEKIVTVIHEITESIPKFGWHGESIISRKRDERRIDAISYKIYRGYPEIRDYIEKQIEQADKKILNPADEVCFCLRNLMKLSDELKNPTEGLEGLARLSDEFKKFKKEASI